LTAGVADARIRKAGPDDALIVAALTLQCARDRGSSGEPGFLDRFAGAWAAQHYAHPVWIAEAGDQHAGHLQAAVVDTLPWPGRAPGAGTLVVETFYLRPEHRGRGIGEQLLGTAVEWARGSGLTGVSISAGSQTRPMLERVGFTHAEAAMELRWS
jgi:GNAT superfamily N-acetyltransferase